MKEYRHDAMWRPTYMIGIIGRVISNVWMSDPTNFYYAFQIYQFPQCDSDEEDEEFKLQDKQLKESIPFAVIASQNIIEVAGKQVRGRLYPWGIVEGEIDRHLYKLLSTDFITYTIMKEHLSRAETSRNLYVFDCSISNCLSFPYIY